jgi:hypothetical protein
MQRHLNTQRTLPLNDAFIVAHGAIDFVWKTSMLAHCYSPNMTPMTLWHGNWCLRAGLLLTLDEVEQSPLHMSSQDCDDDPHRHLNAAIPEPSPTSSDNASEIASNTALSSR